MKQQYSYQITLKPVSENMLDHAPKLQAKNLNDLRASKASHIIINCIVPCSHYRQWRVYTFEPRGKLGWKRPTKQHAEIFLEKW